MSTPLSAMFMSRGNPCISWISLWPVAWHISVRLSLSPSLISSLLSLRRLRVTGHIRQVDQSRTATDNADSLWDASKPLWVYVDVCGSLRQHLHVYKSKYMCWFLIVCMKARLIFACLCMCVSFHYISECLYACIFVPFLSAEPPWDEGEEEDDELEEVLCSMASRERSERRRSGLLKQEENVLIYC